MSDSDIGPHPDDGKVLELYSDAWWDRFARGMVRMRPWQFTSVEMVLDSFDRGWRERRARTKELEAIKAEAASSSRPTQQGLGRVADRAYRQVNVKLGEAEFEALQALAAARDLPPSTLARMLLRNAIREEKL